MFTKLLDAGRKTLFHYNDVLYGVFGKKEFPTPAVSNGHWIVFGDEELYRRAILQRIAVDFDEWKSISSAEAAFEFSLPIQFKECEALCEDLELLIELDINNFQVRLDGFFYAILKSNHKLFTFDHKNFCVIPSTPDETENEVSVTFDLSYVFSFISMGYRFFYRAHENNFGLWSVILTDKNGKLTGALMPLRPQP